MHVYTGTSTYHSTISMIEDTDSPTEANINLCKEQLEDRCIWLLDQQTALTSSATSRFAALNSTATSLSSRLDAVETYAYTASTATFTRSANTYATVASTTLTPEAVGDWVTVTANFVTKIGSGNGAVKITLTDSIGTTDASELTIQSTVMPDYRMVDIHTFWITQTGTALTVALEAKGDNTNVLSVSDWRLFARVLKK